MLAHQSPGRSSGSGSQLWQTASFWTPRGLTRLADGLPLRGEMEAAALYAFARSQGRPVLCFAHVTNQMAQNEGDFEKGEADGAVDALAVLVATARAVLPRLDV